MVRCWHADPFGFLRSLNVAPGLMASAPPSTSPSTGTGVVTFLIGSFLDAASSSSRGPAGMVDWGKATQGVRASVPAVFSTWVACCNLGLRRPGVLARAGPHSPPDEACSRFGNRGIPVEVRSVMLSYARSEHTWRRNMAGGSEKVTFPNPSGERLAARLDRPAGEPRAFALFAHCFTCSI
jgi:hypothetical protein